MIESINTFAAGWTEYFGWAIVQNTVFLGIIILLLRLLRDTPARIRYWIGLVGLVKLIIPPFLAAPFLKPDPIILSSVGYVSTRVFPVLDTTELPPPPPPATIRLDLAGILFLIWAIFLLFFILWPLISSLRMARQLASATPVEGYDADGIPVLKSNSINVPMTFGLFRERIYVPTIWDDWSHKTRTMFLKHEIAHIRRKDGLNRLFQILVQALYFFHPLVWYVSRKLNEFREMACDDMTTGSQKTHSVEYSRALVQIAENLVQSRVDCPSASALIRQKNELLTRVQYQMEDTMKTQSRKRTAFILAALMLLTIPLSWMKAKPAVEDPPPPPPPVTGKIYGKVTDTEGKALPGTNIMLKGTQIGAAADMNGKYFIINVPPGIYDVQASRMGRKAVLFSDVKVSVEKSTKVDFKLEEAVIDMTPGVSVGSTPSEKQKYTPPPPPPANKNDQRSASASNPPPPPADPEDEKVIFVPFDEPPAPIGGFDAIQKNLVYPEIAKKAGVEGRVIVYAQIDTDGKVLRTRVTQSLGPNGCDEAAVRAIVNTPWKPAKQRDLAVKVWIAVPVNFYLPSESDEPKSQGTGAGNTSDALDSYTKWLAHEIPAQYQKPSVEFKGKRNFVWVNFEISTNGNLTPINVKRSSGDKVYDGAALEAVKRVKSRKIALEEPKRSGVLVDLGVPAPPPPAEEKEEIVFVPYDEPPTPVGGFEAIQKKVVYPEIARKAGVEGRVLVYSYVDTTGQVLKTRIIKSLGPNGCDEAAIRAITSLPWKSASQRNRKVAVWIAVPVDFKLKDHPQKLKKEAQTHSSTEKANTGKLWGYVRTNNLEPIPGANVTVEATSYGAATDKNGMYKILNLNPGIYTLKTQMMGFETKLNNRAKVAVNDSTKIDFQLALSN